MNAFEKVNIYVLVMLCKEYEFIFFVVLDASVMGPHLSITI